MPPRQAVLVIHSSVTSSRAATKHQTKQLRPPPPPRGPHSPGREWPCVAAEWWGMDGGQWVGRGRRGWYWPRVKGESDSERRGPGCGPLCVDWREQVGPLLTLAVLSKGALEQTLKSPWFGKEAVEGVGVLLQGCGCSWFSVLLSHGRQDSAIVITNFPLFIKWNSCLLSSQEIQALALSPLLYRTRSPWGGHHSSALSRKNERP